MQQQHLTKYELYIYISKSRDDADYQEWETRYKEKVQQHNSKILNGEPTMDSGFDLFMPNNGTDYGYGVDILVTRPATEPSARSLGVDGARALNMRVRCCMRENVVSHLSSSLLSSVPEADSPDPKIIVPQLTKPARGYYLYPRSSISKTRMRMANSVGIIDSGYRGDIIAAVDTIGVFGSSDIWHVWKETLMPIKKYDRYFQICAPDLSPFMVYIVDDEAGLGEPTARGAGGFGSTGA
jgi:dUTPase